MRRDSQHAMNGTQGRNFAEDPERQLHTFEITETYRGNKEEDNVGTASKEDKRNDSGGRPGTPPSPIGPPALEYRVLPSAQQNRPHVKQQNIAKGQNNIAGAD